MLKLGHRPWGGYIPDIEMWSPQYCQGDTRIVGPAFTVKVRGDTFLYAKTVHSFIRG